MKKPTYIFILPTDKLGGAEQVLKMLLERCIDESVIIKIYFLTSKSSGDWGYLENKEQVDVSYGRTSKIGVGLFMLFFRFKTKNIDYVFTSHTFITGYIGFLRRLNLIKIKYFVARESTTVFSRFTGLKLFFYSLFYWVGYNSVDLLICQTNDMKEKLIKALPKIDRITKIKVIPNPFGFSRINEKNNKKMSLNNFIVSAGRLIDEKGFDILILAFKDLLNVNPELSLIILGEGEKKVELEELVSKQNLTGKVCFAGHVKDVYTYFRNAKMCVVSSRVEGFPNVLLQMMSQNEKVVSTLCAGDIDKIEGLFICPPDDVRSLFSTMKKCLLSDSDNRNRFDKELRGRSIDNYLKTINVFLNEEN